MIMSVGLNCGFAFEKGSQLLNLHATIKASSVAALCGHNPNWSDFDIGSRHRAAVLPSVAEIFDDDLPVFHIRTAELIGELSVPFPLSVSFRTRARQEAQAGQ